MLDSSDFLVAIKKAAIEAVIATNPAGIVYGKVMATDPLEINIEQKLTLGMKQLVLCRDVTEYETKATIGTSTVDDGTLEGITKKGCGLCAGAPPHDHELKSVKHIKTKIIMHNALKVGEEVLLVQAQGGQKYVVIDRVVS